MASVELTNVMKRFGDTVVLSDLSLSVEDGEFVVLLGPSGCGKSTVLRLIAGLDDPNSGTVSIDGRDVSGLKPNERDVAMLFQNYALYPHMTVRANIEFPLVCHRVPRRERDERVEEAAESVGVDHLMDRRPDQLSGGQRQRVALARSLVRRPALFLLDEPLSNLDAKLRAQTREQLVELHQRLGTTVIYVTHDQVEAMTMADRIAVIDQGGVQQIGDPQLVYDRPATTFVARFIGSPAMNCVPGVATVTPEGSVSIETSGGTLLLDSDLAGVTPRDVTVGFRPEAVRRSADGALTATVDGVELLGSEQHLLGRFADGSTFVVREPTEPTPPLPGDTVCVDVAPDELHLFDAATGDRIGS
ncbi:MAG: ABC transporter ATP-binding protein [Acidimicrobiales bacterium]